MIYYCSNQDCFNKIVLYCSLQLFLDFRERKLTGWAKFVWKSMKRDIFWKFQSKIGKIKNYDRNE